MLIYKYQTSRFITQNMRTRSQAYTWNGSCVCMPVFVFSSEMRTDEAIVKTFRVTFSFALWVKIPNTEKATTGADKNKRYMDCVHMF